MLSVLKHIKIIKVLCIFRKKTLLENKIMPRKGYALETIPVPDVKEKVDSFNFMNDEGRSAQDSVSLIKSQEYSFLFPKQSVLRRKSIIQ